MVREVDMRSDTVTKPTPAMRKAMEEAVVGDNVYKEDPTVNELEEKAAKFLGKEAALFVPSGTMGNLASVMSHCWAKGQEVIVGDQSHIFIHEQGGIAQIAKKACLQGLRNLAVGNGEGLSKGFPWQGFNLAARHRERLSLGGLHVSAVQTLEDGTFDLEQLKERIRPRIPRMAGTSQMEIEYPEPTTALICLENTHNIIGGRVLPVSFIQQVCALAGSIGIPVHMDGARIINASVHCGVPVHEIVKECASVMICLSKGVGAPIGSVVAGSKQFIERVQRCCKTLGGGMRQAGVVAAAGLVGLESAEERMRADHQRTKRLAQGIHELKSELITCDPDLVETNIVLLQFPSPDFTSQDFVKRLAEVKKGDKEQVVVKATLWFKNSVRCVLHSDLTQEDVDCAMKKIRDIVS